jgi:hypothetical protein
MSEPRKGEEPDERESQRMLVELKKHPSPTHRPRRFGIVLEVAGIDVDELLCFWTS